MCILIRATTKHQKQKRCDLQRFLFYKRWAASYQLSNFRSIRPPAACRPGQRQSQIRNQKFQITSRAFHTLY